MWIMYPGILMLVALLRHSTCERRIVEGVKTNKSYMVYIVWDNATKNEFADFNTICGGVLLSPIYVLTSSVCLFMHPTQYVIAGYNRYIPHGLGRTEEENECMTVAKRYISQHNHSDTPTPFGKWYYMDIGVATLETPYDFNDDEFERKCSYKPTATALFLGGPPPGTHVVILGWGSTKYHAPEHHDIDMNADFLRATSTVVMDDADCEAAYNETGEVAVINDMKYRFCTDGEGSLDAEGKYIRLYRRHVANNGTKGQCLFALNAENVYNKKIDTCLKKNRSGFRRNGSCQNDHGGPVVEYIDGIEYVVGILSTYLVDSNMQCVGPTMSTKFIRMHIGFLEKFNASIEPQE